LPSPSQNGSLDNVNYSADSLETIANSLEAIRASIPSRDFPQLTLPEAERVRRIRVEKYALQPGGEVDGVIHSVWSDSPRQGLVIATSQRGGDTRTTVYAVDEAGAVSKHKKGRKVVQILWPVRIVAVLRARMGDFVSVEKLRGTPSKGMFRHDGLDRWIARTERRLSPYTASGWRLYSPWTLTIAAAGMLAATVAACAGITRGSTPEAKQNPFGGAAERQTDPLGNNCPPLRQSLLPSGFLAGSQGGVGEAWDGRQPAGDARTYLRFEVDSTTGQFRVKSRGEQELDVTVRSTISGAELGHRSGKSLDFGVDVSRVAACNDYGASVRPISVELSGGDGSPVDRGTVVMKVVPDGNGRGGEVSMLS
jgi:hypothetical protein